jgi:hypothetical protein
VAQSAKDGEKLKARFWQKAKRCVVGQKNDQH